MLIYGDGSHDSKDSSPRMRLGSCYELNNQLVAGLKAFGLLKLHQNML